MRVFVTGATGCVGSHVVDRLRQDGHEILALVRKTSDTRHLREQNVELIVGDVTDYASIEHGLSGRGIDAVIHSAAVVVATGDWSHYERVGVQGTRNIVQAMHVAGVRRLVHVSSTAVYGVRDAPSALREDQPLEQDIPSWNHYVREKALAERVVWEAHEADRVCVTALRPGVILGLRDRNIVPGILANLANVRGSVIGTGNNRVPYVVAQDVADAIVRTLTSKVSEGRAYNLASTPTRTQIELYRLFAEAAGLSVPATRTPRAVAMFVSRAVNRLHKLLRRPGDPPMDPIGIMIWGSDAVVDSSRAEADLGWRAGSDLAQSIRDSVAWYASQRTLAA